MFCRLKSCCHLRTNLEELRKKLDKKDKACKFFKVLSSATQRTLSIKMTAVTSLTNQLLKAPPRIKNVRYKLNTWKKKATFFHTAPDDEKWYGLGRPESDLLPELADTGIVPRNVFTDEWASGFICHSFHHFKLRGNSIRPQIRALQWYLTKHVSEYNIAPKFADAPGYQLSQRAMKRIVDSKEYKEHVSESALMWTDADMDAIKNMSIENGMFPNYRRTDRHALSQKLRALVLNGWSVRVCNAWGLNETDVEIVNLNAARGNRFDLWSVRATFRVNSHGNNQEKHRNKDSVHNAICDCYPVHVANHANCVVGLAQKYKLLRDKDFVELVIPSRSQLKCVKAADRPYFRRPCWVDRKNKAKGMMF